MSGQDLESLHEQASGHYLRGELDSAVSVWERVLSFDPSDERAQEGVRLCRQMVDLEELPETGGAEPEPLADDDLDLLDFKLDLGGGASPSQAAAAAEPEEEFLDLSGLSEDVGADANPAVHEAPADERPAPSGDEVPMPKDGVSASDSPLWQWNAPEGDPLAIEGASWDSAAEIELRRRVNELMASALVDIEEGRRQDALKTLDRLLILDEENDSAIALKNKLLEEDEAEAAAPSDTASSEPPFDEAGPGSSIPLARPPAPAPAAAPPATPLVARPAGTRVGVDRQVPNRYRPPAPQPAAKEGSRADDDDGVTVKSEQAKSEQRKGLPRRRKSVLEALPPWVRWAAPLALVLVAGLLLAFRWMGSDAGSGADPSVEGTAGPAATAPATEAAVHVVDAPQGTAPPPAPLAQKDPSELQRRGAAALAAGDFAAAVLVYGDLLKQEPDSAEFQRQFRTASDGYREQRATQEKWKLAFEAFDDKRYTEALRLFYRLPGGDPERLERYRVNGWYNLGVQALQASDCKGAVSHFKEAETLRPRDGGVQDALELADSCGRSPSVRAQIQALQLRSLED